MLPWNKPIERVCTSHCKRYLEGWILEGSTNQPIRRVCTSYSKRHLEGWIMERIVALALYYWKIIAQCMLYFY